MDVLPLRSPIITALATCTLLAAAAVALTAPAPSAAQSPDYQVPTPPPEQPPYLTPTPIVRLVGRTTKTGVRITLLRTKSPRDSTVTVRCRGGRKKGCAFSSKTRKSPKTGLVRFRELERRMKAGVLIRIYLRRGNTIGKYTSFRIRKKKVPSRNDACLFPGDPFEPRTCP